MRTNVLTHYFAMVVAACALAGCSKISDNKTSEPLNVVYILADNQSYYEISAHGHSGVATPHIDQLAAQGVDFQRFYAPPYCSPSRAVMMTGKYSLRSGIHNTIGGRSILHKQDVTIANILQDNGYTTGIFGKWHLGFTYPHQPALRGFDEVFVHSGGGIGQLEDYYQNSHYNPTFEHNGELVHTTGYSTDVIFDHAIQWIENQEEGPFFSFISTPVVHTPHHGPKDDEGNNTGLQGMLSNLDANVGKLISYLDKTGLSENTLVIYASDQGMSYRGSPQGYRKTYVAHDAMHHVPFIVKGPNIQPQVNTNTTGMIDFVPTVLDMLSIAPVTPLDGVSLKRALYGETAYLDERILIIQTPRQRDSVKWKNASIKQGPWRLVNGEALFNINSDPVLEHDVAPNNPVIVAALKAAYDAFWQSLPPQQDTLSRHVIGMPEQGETKLNAMDWYRGAQPWTLDAMRKSPNKRKNQNGTWAITVAEEGRYRFELRRFPREANTPIGVHVAKMEIAGQTHIVSIEENETAAVFEITLCAGKRDLQTWFDYNDQFELNYGAIFVYISRL